ncbi:hypothetical protein Emed_005100 [Eimeria media]
MLSAPGAPASTSSPWGAPTGGPLGRLYGPRNILYVRNLSPLVTEEHLRAIFSHCAELLRVEFKPLPGGGGPLGAPGSGRYCELEFADSAGITAASQLNGTELLGLAMQVSVLNPGAPGPSSENAMKSVTPLPTPLPAPTPPTGAPVVIPPPVQPLGSVAAAAAAAAAAASVAGGGPTVLGAPGLSITNPAIAAAAAAAALPASTPALVPAAAVAAAPTPVTAVEIAMQNHLANLQAVQAAAMQAKQLAARKKSELGLGVAVTAVDGRLPPAQSLVSGVLIAEPETDQLERTCFLQGFPNDYDEKEVTLLLNDLGKISGIRLGTKSDGSKFALVEFASAADAAQILGMDGRSIGDSVLTLKKSASLVSFRDPDGVLFEVPAPPILSQIKQQQQLLQSPEQQKEMLETRERRVASAKAAIERRLARAREKGEEAGKSGDTATEQQQQQQQQQQQRDDRRRSLGSSSRSRSVSRDKRTNGRRQRRNTSRSLSAPSRSLSPAAAKGPPPRGRASRRGSMDSEKSGGPRRPLLRAPGSQAAATALKERLKRAASGDGEEGPHTRSASLKRRSQSPGRRSRSPQQRSPSHHRHQQQQQQHERQQQQQQQQRRSSSLKRRSVSPRGRASPLRRPSSPSPKKRSESPGRRLSPHRKRSVSSRRHSPLQQRRPISPRRQSLSPAQKRSLSPRGRSPSPQQRRSPVSVRDRRMRSRSLSSHRGNRPSSPAAAAGNAAAAAAAAAGGAREHGRSRSPSQPSRREWHREEERPPAAAAGRRRSSRSFSPGAREKESPSMSPSSAGIARGQRSRSPGRQGARRSRSPQRRSSRSPQRRSYRSPQRRSQSPLRRPRSPPRRPRSRSPARRYHSPQRRSASLSPSKKPHQKGGYPSVRDGTSRSPSPAFRRGRASRSPSPKWRRSRSPGIPGGGGASRVSPDWGPPGASTASRGGGPRGPPTHPRRLPPSPRRGPMHPYSPSRERSLSHGRGRGPQMSGGPLKRGRSPSPIQLRRRSPSPRRGELRSWRRSPGSPRSPPRRFPRRASPDNVGPYFDPRGLPPPMPPFRDREGDWGRPLPPMGGGPRPYARDMRPPRRGGPPLRDEGPLPRRQQQHRGAPPPAVDRYKSQSRSLSEEGFGDRGSLGGSPAAAADGREKGREEEQARGASLAITTTPPWLSLSNPYRCCFCHRPRSKGAPQHTGRGAPKRSLGAPLDEQISSWLISHHLTQRLSRPYCCPLLLLSLLSGAAVAAAAVNAAALAAIAVAVDLPRGILLASAVASAVAHGGDRGGGQPASPASPSSHMACLLPLLSCCCCCCYSPVAAVAALLVLLLLLLLLLLFFRKLHKPSHRPSLVRAAPVSLPSAAAAANELLMHLGDASVLVYVHSTLSTSSSLRLLSPTLDYWLQIMQTSSSSIKAGETKKQHNKQQQEPPP